ncbi:MAG: B3/4 domain-containing protein [Oscillatoria sp. SIO1A7]|nr:B3/4 domain-containing protein [Oscillatoria sp. SIO1A7]
MIQLTIHKDAYDLGIHNPIACLIRNIEIKSELSNSVSGDARDMIAMLETNSQSILLKPEVIAFRQLFENLGYPNQIPAGQRLIESFQKKGFKAYNNIIDSYNIASCLFGSGLGLHDAEGIKQDIHIYRAKGNERIKPIFKDKKTTIPNGDIVYSSSGKVIAWLGKKDVDSDEFKVVDNTKKLLLVALGNSQTSLEYNRSVCISAIRLMRKSCPNIYAQFILTVLAD